MNLKGLIGGIPNLAAEEIAERRKATLIKLDFSNSQRIIFHVKSGIRNGRNIIPKACFAWLIFSHANKYLFLSGRLNYYSEMRDFLKHVFSKQVVLEDGSVFYYSILPYQLKNALGYNIDVLQEYNFAKKEMSAGNLPANYTRKKTAIGTTFKTQKQLLKRER